MGDFCFPTQAQNLLIWIGISRIESRTSEEIRNLRLCNCDLEETFLSVNSFDEILEHYKGKCIMNLDRCINITEDVMRVVRRHNMTDQILLKSDTRRNP